MFQIRTIKTDFFLQTGFIVGPMNLYFPKEKKNEN